jgi:hypothetical protein
MDSVKECSTEHGSPCQVFNGKVSNDGTISSRYGMGGAELGTMVVEALGLEDDTGSRRRSLNGRRLETASEDITDPVMCIHEGDTFIFEIEDRSHYPVYQKDSLINTNPDFDYGGFKILEDRLISQSANSEGEDEETLQYFAYSFTEAGTYHFADAAESEKTMIITVLSPNGICPDAETFLLPKTQDSLSVFGVSLDSTLILEPDYQMLLIMLFCFLFMFLFILVLVKYIGSGMWKIKGKENIPYRKGHQDFKFEKLKFLFSDDKQDQSSFLDQSQFLLIDKKGEDVTPRAGGEGERDEAVGDLASLDSDFVSDDEDPGIDLKKLYFSTNYFNFLIERS